MAKTIVKVYSYPRSGNYFLTESLRKHFYTSQDFSLTMNNRGMHRYSDGEMTTQQHLVTVKTGKLFGSHSLPHHCNWSKKNGIYIRRNPFDVFLSYFKLMHNITYEVNKNKFNNWITERGIKIWVEHIKKWAATGIYTIYFEDLVKSYEEEMQKIADTFNLPTPNNGYQAPDPVGWNPSGRIGKDTIGYGKRLWSDKKIAILEYEMKEAGVEI